MTHPKTKTRFYFEAFVENELSCKVRAATRGNLKTLPTLDEKETQEVNYVFSAEEAEMIRFGFIPMTMDERWFIYYEDKRLFFHRSWTELCVFIIHFHEEGDALVAYRLDTRRSANINLERQWDAAFHLIRRYLLDPGLYKPSGLGSA